MTTCIHLHCKADSVSYWYDSHVMVVENLIKSEDFKLQQLTVFHMNLQIHSVKATQHLIVFLDLVDFGCTLYIFL